MIKKISSEIIHKFKIQNQYFEDQNYYVLGTIKIHKKRTSNVNRINVTKLVGDCDEFIYFDLSLNEHPLAAYVVPKAKEI